MPSGIVAVPLRRLPAQKMKKRWRNCAGRLRLFSGWNKRRAHRWACTRQGLQGTGFDWDQLAKRYVEEQAPALKGKLEFDSQKDLFSVYARDEAALRTFIRGFREACEDAGQRTDRVVAER